VKISTDALAVLSTLEVKGHEVRIIRQLDKKLYKEVDTVLRALGGAWSRKAKAHVFPATEAPPAERLDATIIAGDIRTATDLGYFQTPREVIDLMLNLLGMRPRTLRGAGPAFDPKLRWLEPSCGEGAIIQALLEQGVEPGRVVGVELDEHRARRCRLGRGTDLVAVVIADFLTMRASRLVLSGQSHEGEGFDRIIMNPPFGIRVRATTGYDWMDHVRHAHGMLRAGGKLCSVAPAGIVFRDDQRHVDFRAWYESIGGSLSDVPHQAFAVSGTNVSTVLLTIPA